MRLYHFINVEYGMQDIRRRRIKVATIDQLNDPFELLGVASRDHEIRRRYSRLKRGLAQYMGLLCFSANWKNPVQWSHYADHHRGLCLGFDISADVHPVVYADRRLRPDVRTMSAAGEAARAHMLRILTTKFRHWAYEQEHRLFVRLSDKDPENGLYFFDFGDMLQLRAVIVGANSVVTRKEAKEAIGDLSHVKCFKARLAFRTFTVVQQRDDLLWKYSRR